jgi:4-amino-4-deoxy-L-arabinose transferase-like glycosyltransferase
VLLSLLTIVLVYRFTRQRYGPQAGLWAAALLALNEYYLAVSARATAHVPHLFFVTAAVLSFCQFLSAQRAVYLYAAGAFTGLAFYFSVAAAPVPGVAPASRLSALVAAPARVAGRGSLRPGNQPGSRLELEDRSRHGTGQLRH